MGSTWLAVRHRRVRRRELDDLQTHPGAPQTPPTSSPELVETVEIDPDEDDLGRDA